MAQLDLVGRKLDLKIVYWGPAWGGKTTSLRSLHGGVAPADQGEIQSVETADERTYYFDYVPLDLPRFQDFKVHVHAYTVPGQEMYVETRKRLLRGVDGVIFVADATPSAAAATNASWKQLDECLNEIEYGKRAHPVLVAVNKIDVPGARHADDVREDLAAAAPARLPIDVVETAAVLGRGIVRCFRTILVAATEAALTGAHAGAAAAARADFLAKLEAYFHRSDDGAAVDGGGRRRSVVVATPGAPHDPAGLEVALESTRWLTQRDRDVHELHRQHAHGKLLLDIGRLCLEAGSPEEFACQVLSTLVWNLEASSGWIGIPDPAGGTKVLDGKGPAPEAVARTVGRVAAARALDAETGETVRVEFPLGTGIPNGPDGKECVLAPFATGDGRRGWLLLVPGPAGRSAGDETDDVLAPAGAYVGLTLARLAALEGLREANSILERRVAERTADLRRERDSLEVRVKERTAELEAAKHATVEAERRLIDLERDEGVKRLAAGLAHEVNNPLGAARANLDFTRDTLARLAPGLPSSARDETEEALEAVGDARRELDRVAASVASLFDGAAASRRAAHKTPVAAFVREAVAAHRSVRAEGHAPAIVETAAVCCGIPPAEGSRWLFRLLGALDRAGRETRRVEIERDDAGPRVVVTSVALGGRVVPVDLDPLALEIARAGGKLLTIPAGDTLAVRIALPRAIGDASLTAVRGAR